MKRPGLAATAPFALAIFLAACGSVSGIDDLFQDTSGAGGAAATTAGQGGATGVTTGGVGGDVASTAVSSSSGTIATSGSTTTGQTTTGPGSTASSSTATASSTASSSSGGPTSTVYCNNAPCAAGEICCFNTKQQNDHCGQPDACGDGFIELECNGPEDCPGGGICCADVDYTKNPPYKGISCKQSCNSPTQNLIVCSDANPACPLGSQCESSQVLGQGYKVCK